jgi:hypothetical protein
MGAIAAHTEGERRRDGQVVGGAGQPPAPPSRPGHGCGSSALVITDSRVSFSDALICVTASPYVARQSCSMWARPWTCCHAFCGPIIVIYIT